MNEHAVVFPCEEDALLGIVHSPDQAETTGVVIIVAGGPQYRVGAHRQFVVLGRELARQGIPVLRFDHRGTGDSGGSFRGFLDMDADIRSAIDTLFQHCSNLKRVMLWGECESASAAAFYAYRDPRVAGIFMVNPWVRTDAGYAKTYLKHYYWNRLRDPRLWQKVRDGQFSLMRSLKAGVQLLKHVTKKNPGNSKKSSGAEELTSLPLPERLTKSLQRFPGKTYILTSGNDYIAQEFTDFTNSSAVWKSSGLQEKIFFNEMTDADHTFSRTVWRTKLFAQTAQWLKNHLTEDLPDQKSVTADNDH